MTRKSYQHVVCDKVSITASSLENLVNILKYTQKETVVIPSASVKEQIILLCEAVHFTQLKLVMNVLYL